MTITDYLSDIKHIDSSTPGSDGIVFSALSAMDPDIDYRSASLIFADVPVIRDTFEALWAGYEDYLDRQNYEREHSEPVPVSVIIDRVVEDLRKRCSIGTGNDYEGGGGKNMIVFNARTGQSRSYVDECMYPGRVGCRGCEYALDPKLSDPGCLIGPAGEPMLKERGLWPVPTEKSTKYLKKSETYRLGND